MKFYRLLIILLIASGPVVAQSTSIPIDKPYALVAGGSKGIGYAIAEALAKRGFHLVLIARGEDGLMKAKQKLEAAYPVHVECMSYDLSIETSAEAISKWCIERNLPLKVLCNVAGRGGAKDYLEVPLDTVRYMVRLNVESPMALTYLLLPLLEKNAPSYILNVSSMAGYAPMPAKNIYSATKAALLNYSYALRYQLKEKNISVSCLTPGPVFTKEEIKRDTKKTLGAFGVWMAVKPAKVGEIAVRQTLDGKMLIIPGTFSKVTSSVIRILPRRWITAIYSKVDSGG